jgi:predicted outer membrane repeat protein
MILINKFISMKTLKLLITFALMLLVFLSSAQQKTTSYWVTTDAGEQLEIFPSETPYNPNANRAPGSLTTLFAANNSGNFGGALYFDITVGSQNISITSLDVNSAETGPMVLSVYTLVGTAFGNEPNAGAWGSPTTGSGVGAGLNLPSNIT